MIFHPNTPNTVTLKHRTTLNCEDCLNSVADPDNVNQATNSVFEIHKTKANKANAEYKKKILKKKRYMELDII